MRFSIADPKDARYGQHGAPLHPVQPATRGHCVEDQGKHAESLVELGYLGNSPRQNLRCLATRVDHDGGVYPDRDRDSGSMVNRPNAR